MHKLRQQPLVSGMLALASIVLVATFGAAPLEDKAEGEYQCIGVAPEEGCLEGGKIRNPAMALLQHQVYRAQAIASVHEGSVQSGTSSAEFAPFPTLAPSIVEQIPAAAARAEQQEDEEDEEDEDGAYLLSTDSSYQPTRVSAKKGVATISLDSMSRADGPGLLEKTASKKQPSEEVNIEEVNEEIEEMQKSLGNMVTQLTERSPSLKKATAAQVAKKSTTKKKRKSFAPKPIVEVEQVVPVRVSASVAGFRPLKKMASILSTARKPARQAPPEIPQMIAKSFRQKVVPSSGRLGVEPQSDSDLAAEGRGPGATARLDQSGYLAISSMLSHQEMKVFVGRVITDLGYRVTDDGDADLDGLVAYYSGEKDSQTMKRLRQEIQDITTTPGKWITKL